MKVLNFEQKRNEKFIEKMNEKLRSANHNKWYVLKGLEAFEVHPASGSIRSTKTKQLKYSFNYKDGSGRLKFNFRVKGKQHNISFARVLIFSVLGLDILDASLRIFHADHIDDNRANDNISNLQLLTSSQNMRKSINDRKKKNYIELKKRASQLALVA